MKIILSFFRFSGCFPFFVTINISYICIINSFQLSGAWENSAILRFGRKIGDLKSQGVATLIKSLPAEVFLCIKHLKKFLDNL